MVAKKDKSRIAAQSTKIALLVLTLLLAACTGDLQDIGLTDGDAPIGGDEETEAGDTSGDGDLPTDGDALPDGDDDPGDEDAADGDPEPDGDDWEGDDEPLDEAEPDIEPEFEAPPCMIVTPDPVDFGPQNVGTSAAIEVQIQNDCNNPATFCGLTLSEQTTEDAFFIVDHAGVGGTTVGPGDAVFFHVAFEPTQVGAYAALLTICSNNPDAFETRVPVVGQAYVHPISIEPFAIDFGQVALGQTACGTTRLHNLGAHNVEIIDLLISYDGEAENPFAFSDEQHMPPFAIPPQEFAVFEACYTPTEQTEGDEATLIILIDDAITPKVEIHLQGLPAWAQCDFSLLEDPDLVLPFDTIDFGEVPLGQTETRTLRIAAYGDLPCEVDQAVWEVNSSPAFNIYPEILPPVDPGDSRDIVIGYTPPQPYPSRHIAVLRMETNDPRDEIADFTIEMEGVGVLPSISCTPETTQANPYDFGEVLKYKCSDPVAFHCVNQGIGLLEITDYELVVVEGTYILGDWSSPPLGADPWLLRPQSINPEDQIDFDLAFCPSGFERTNSGHLKIFSNDPEKPEYTIYFSGRGINCPMDTEYNPETGECETCNLPPDGGPPWELCDGYDNDCDWETDEDFNLGQPCEGVGACGAGVTICDPDSVFATICSTDIGGPDYDGSPELCDGIDNDCDGQTDEDFNIGDPCAGLGECRLGRWRCVPGDPYARECDANDDGTPELCDGRDNDCDGVTDNGPFDILGMPGVICEDCIGTLCGGAAGCDYGVWTCLLQSIEHAGEMTTHPELTVVCEHPMGGAEYCDGHDNDCDGATDEDYPIGMECDGQGACGIGVTICDPDYIFGTICSTDIGGWEYEGSPELCDGLDNDCDGVTDEGFGVGELCVGTGACGLGQVECDSNNFLATICSTDPRGSEDQSTAELCDGIDNDCDGEKDEDFSIGDACQGIGECGIGVTECASAATTRCSTDRFGSDEQAVPEVCDGKDNDCDGQTDEEFLLGQICDSSNPCEPSYWECRNGRPYCPPADPPPMERCDGYDNDCDGLTDEDYLIGSECWIWGCCQDGTCGDCLPGIIECVDQYEAACHPNMAGTNEWPPFADACAETCDGTDDDCDGATDEDYDAGAPCEGVGECGVGVIECDTTETTRCSTNPGGSQDMSRFELCDGLDNDCDGETDENYRTGEDCWLWGCCADGSCGDCLPGIIECVGQLSAECRPNMAGTDEWPPFEGACTETCDGTDDDCDGETDEGFQLGESCVGIGQCAGDRNCGDFECDDVVISGHFECNPSDPTESICSTMPGGSEDRSSGEYCDGVDNDCDGETDEDYPVGEVCWLRGCCEDGSCGDCVPGAMQCDEYGYVVCLPTSADGDELPPVNDTCTEICDDGFDNDCDGATDEDCP